MTTIKLVGLSKRGKQVVKTHGPTWRAQDKRDSVLFSDRAGPWLLVVPLGREPSDAASRWVHLFDDPNFKVMPA